MTENKKQETNTEENKKKDVKLPHLNFGYLGTSYIHTEKGMCMWMTPSNLSLQESVKYLKFVIAKYEDAIEVNKKKQEEEEKNKLVAKNEKKEYQSVK